MTRDDHENAHFLAFVAYNTKAYGHDKAVPLPPFPVTPMVLLLTRFCMILPYPAQFPQKIVKYGSFTQILIPCNIQLPSTIAQIQIIQTEGFQGCLRSCVDTQQLLSTRRLSHGAHGDTGVGHVHRIASKSIKKP